MTKDLQSDYKKKTHNATIRKKKKNYRKIGKRLNRHYFEEDIQIANMYMK